MAQRYRLKLTELKFCSVVDNPAQPNAKTLLIKRAGAVDEITATARIAKVDEELGLAFFWAFTSTNPDGTDHFDLQGDTIDQDFIKAAMDFMIDGGGAVDEMHDEQPGAGQVVFAMPMTPDIAKAFGVVSKTVGLMIAIKPAPAVLAKLRDGTYNGVSIGGAGEREAVKRTATRKRRFVVVGKDVVLTDLVEGHQHALDLDDPAGWCGDRLSTTQGMITGSEAWHSHVWTFDPNTGAVTIAADSGHTHTVDGVVPPDVLAVFALNEKAEDAENATAVLERVLVGDAGTASVSVSVAARASHGNSTPEAGAVKVAPQPENAQMNFAKMLSVLLAMSPAQRDHVSKLAPDEAEAFVGKPAAERESITKTALDSDAVVYTCTDGTEIRKSQGALVEKQARQLDDQAKEIAKARGEAEQVRLEKRATEVLKHFGGSLPVHVAMLKAIDGIADEPTRTAALQALKGADAALAELGVAKGINPGEDVRPTDKNGAYAALAKGLTAFAASKGIAKVWTEGLDAFASTPEGAALKQAYDQAAQ